VGAVIRVGPDVFEIIENDHYRHVLGARQAEQVCANAEGPDEVNLAV
jgi:hypothetical protein